MKFHQFAFVALFVAAAPLVAETHVEPAVQPGGDIPKSFHPIVAPVSKGSDIPQHFTAPRSDFQYVRREVEIPMRDGVKLYAVLIIPKGSGRFPIMLDLRPIQPTRARLEASERFPKTFFHRFRPNLCARATSSPLRMFGANTGRAATM